MGDESGKRFSKAFRYASKADVSGKDKTQLFKNLYKQKMIDEKTSYFEDEDKFLTDEERKEKEGKKSKGKGGRGGGGSGTLRQIRKGTGGPFASGSPRKKLKSGGLVKKGKPKLCKKGWK